jgi:Short C-terminal domain
MDLNDHLRTLKSPFVRWVLCGILGMSAPVLAHAGWFDALLGQSASRAEGAPADAKQRVWRIREFTRIELVSREAGASDNQHPATVAPDALKQQLALVQASVKGAPQTLFAADELGDLVGPLAQALDRARPGDDVLLLSSSRREGGLLAAPTAVTARLFVQGGNLQLIVHDARFEFYDAYRGTQNAPRFSYGSRASAGSAAVQSDGAKTQRADWLSIPLTAQNAPSAPSAPSAQPATMPAPVQSVAPPPARIPKDAAAGDDIERRLETLKRLRDKGLITEDEYQQKRKEILQQL